jgi:GAF domain-containing protein/anti-sigma regulatory factor (Ser/Thr protein kinase)
LAITQPTDPQDESEDARRAATGGTAAAEHLDALTDALLARLRPEELLSELLERIIRILDADTAAILLVDEERTKLTARAARGLEEEVERGFSLPIGEGFAGRVAATRRPVVLSEVKPGDVVNPLLLEKKIRSMLGVPLVAQGTLVGVLHVGTLTPREFAPADIQLMQVVADRAALAVEHARVLAEEQRARSEAERAARELRNLQYVSEVALSHLDLESLLAETLSRITEVLQTDTAAVLLLEEDGETLVARAAKGLEEEVERGFSLRMGTGFAGRVAATRAPVILEEVRPGKVANPLLLEKQLQSMLGVPLIVEDRLIGVLHVGTLTARKFTDEDVRLLELVAGSTALAIDHNRLFQAHVAVEAMQRSLVPAALPDLPGLAFAARYVSAATDTPVGGDWYDVIARHDGTVGLVIGDVLGRGTKAAALMAQLRSALRAHALQDASPSEVANRVARFADSFHAGDMATFIYGVLDWQSSTWRFVSGAHPPPLVLCSDGSTHFADQVPGVPLGVASHANYEESEVALSAGDTLLLYTDGLVERRDERLTPRLARLAEAAARGPRDPDALCGYVLDTMLEGGVAQDDVAVLAARVLAGFGSLLHVSVPARPAELASFRRLLRRWLAEMGASEREIEALTLASNEACANAVEHAYGPEDAHVEITAEKEGQTVTITVRDHGQWRGPRGEHRGRGLVLMKAYVDNVELSRHGDGTEVRLMHRLKGASA